MSKEKYGFVYLWYDRKHKRFYVGCHWGTEDDGYICSSRWMKQSYKRRPQDCKRRILKTGLERQDMYVEEQKYLDMINKDEIKPINESPKYYNLCLSSKKPWHQYEDRAKTIGEKISLAKRGKSNGPLSEETKQKISEANRGKVRTEEQRKRNGDARRGQNLSEEHKQKIKDGLRRRYPPKPPKEPNPNRYIGRTGQNLSEEHKQKISESRSNGKHWNIGKKWYNNGLINKLSKECPAGFVLGRLQ